MVDDETPAERARKASRETMFVHAPEFGLTPFMARALGDVLDEIERLEGSGAEVMLDPVKVKLLGEPTMRRMAILDAALSLREAELIGERREA